MVQHFQEMTIVNVPKTHSPSLRKFTPRGIYFLKHIPRGVHLRPCLVNVIVTYLTEKSYFILLSNQILYENIMRR